MSIADFGDDVWSTQSLLPCSDGNAITHLSCNTPTGLIEKERDNRGRFKREVDVTTNGNTGGSDRAGTHLLKS